MPPESSEADYSRMTIEAFADTIIPGEKRFPGDHAIAGATTGGGAVAAGAVELLQLPAVGIVGVLDTLVVALNNHAEEYAQEHELVLDESLPPFVALAFADRTALVQTLTDPVHPEKEMWVALALFSNMAYDSAAHLPTAQAIEAGHPGLIAMGVFRPDADGLWRFPKFSYGRALASLHPNTTSNGSPA
jgi:enediyne biosynthesis protein E8